MSGAKMPDWVKVLMLKGEQGDPPSDAQVESAVDSWLDENGQQVISPWMDENGVDTIDDWMNAHPEATTTVQDNSITTVKIMDGQITKGKLSDAVNDLIGGYHVNKTLCTLPNYGQDACIYDGTVFEFGANNGIIKIYDMETEALIAESTLAGAIKPHANAVTFGNKLNSTDAYPLLYVTGYNGDDADGNRLPRGTCFVYKINADYSTEYVQGIYIGFINEVLWKGTEVPTEVVTWGDFFVDPDNEYLYCITTLSTNGLKRSRLFKFNIPDTSNTTVTLTQNDIIEYYDFPIYPYPQGATYYDGKLYLVCGNDHIVEKSSALYVVDLSALEQIGIVSLSDIMYEPESVFEYNGEIYVGSRSVYKLGFVPIYTNVGNLADLETSDSTTIVKAINSNANKVNALNTIFEYKEIAGSIALNDANDAELMTFYYAYRSANNVPATGMLFTYGTDSFKLQIIVNRLNIFTRTYSSGSWSTWRQFNSTTVSS